MMHSTDLYHILPDEALKEKSFVWEKNDIFPFNDLIVGWNARRPNKGHYLISLSLKLKKWTPWFSYALWGANEQRSFEHDYGPLQIFQDTINVAENETITGWRIKVEAQNLSNLQGFCAVYATMPPLKNKEKRNPPHRSLFPVFQMSAKSANLHKTNLSKGSYIKLDVPGMSQIKINDKRNMRLCSPTSTTAVVHYLKKEATVTPLQFADRVWDSHFDIYGHWVFAAAQAYAELGEDWETRVMYLNGFEDIYRFLHAGYPVVVSVKGSLPGSFHPYSQGHLLVVRGYDPILCKVLCMDPAYPKSSLTHVSYSLTDFLNTWQRRKNIAYIFKRRFHRIDIPIS